MAWQLAHMNGIIIAAMDARRSQVYNAVFRAKDGVLERLSPDRAIGLEELEQELAALDEPKILVGDRAQLCYNNWSERMSRLSLAPVHLRWQTAWGVARAAEGLVKQNKLVSGDELIPAYHRLSQAERERLEKGLPLTVETK
jgi:tRNA threonylcarbamoyladenosine biosynthesis protein TsaB